MFGICLLEIRGLFTKWATFPFLIKKYHSFSVTEKDGIESFCELSKHTKYYTCEKACNG